MTQLPILVPAANLAKSPSNVRTVSDPIADAQLEANIAVKGVRQNLIGVPVSRKKGHYRVIAGGRRLDAVYRLIEKGVFDADYQLAVLVLGNAKDAIETSLEENFFNLTMNPADTCRAFQDIIESEGKTPEDVAKRFGLTERFVRSRLRLADLADPIFEALRNGEITLNVAVAYASSSDRTRQAETFEQLKDGYYRANVNEIRRQLAEDTYVGNDPKALLVGRAAYIEAGGRVDLDLFTDATTERWIDGDILNRLVADKMAAAAETMREHEGFAEVRVLPSTHVTYNDTWDLRPLKGETPSLTDEQQARLKEIEVELEAANEAYEDAAEDDAAELANRVETLEAEYRAIEKPVPVLTDEQKAGALAYVVIGHDGQPRLHEQLYVVPAEEDEADGTDDDADNDEVGEDVVITSGKPSYSQRLSQELAEMKSELVRVHVASDPGFALDLGTFWMADKAMRKYGGTDLATELKADKPWSALIGFQSGTRAAEEWGKIDDALDRSWTEVGDACARYDAFCALPDEARAAWLAWAIARTLHAVVAGRDGEDFIDHLGTKLEIDLAAWWRPTANNYFDRLSSKAAILAHLEEIGGKELSSRYGASKKHDLATSAEKIFAGSVPIEAELREAALAWVPDVMRFTQPDAQIEAELANDLAVPDGEGDLPQAA
ncbi:ParB/RepB/Spo0J family partition protein [Sphingobium sp. H39-3-25]|uniref:Chromosome partitioning protein, ParB family n=1 Tax=Sphingopyxis fribergensis TaxID=1515612 RepID=A0A0A7PDH5_9SPHN|nr:ParB/RepB/Spo0J family partition protein [Sphingopyxis fribergensis]AJA07238.1 chromosome partitioning protein, ParB family [Sphingopyxis fribergensis]MDF0545561.1 ParB/RepB/Spo0J family partition protein [Sphingobium arseniciresistens]